MRSYQSLPQGLKTILCLATLGWLVGISQTLYWFYFAHEFFPLVMILQGYYAVVALLLGTGCVALGWFGFRCAFAITSLVTAAFHIGVAAYLNVKILMGWLPDIFSGSWHFLMPWHVLNWICAWNGIEIAINTLVGFYLLKYEFRLFAQRHIKHQRPLAPVADLCRLP